MKYYPGTQGRGGQREEGRDGSPKLVNNTGPCNELQAGH